MTPLGPDEGLHLAGDRKPILGHDLVERERLPEGGVVDGRSRLIHDQGHVHGDVALVDVVASFDRAVAPSMTNHRGGDAIAECGR